MRSCHIPEPNCRTELSFDIRVGQFELTKRPTDKDTDWRCFMTVSADKLSLVGGHATQGWETFDRVCVVSRLPKGWLQDKHGPIIADEQFNDGTLCVPGTHLV